jgi:leader peptidase (prepilin peptidase)/N-methyltransferase
MPVAATGLRPGRILTCVGAAAAAAVAIARFGATAHGLIIAFFVATLAVLAAIDLDRRIVPNRIVLPAALVVLCARIATSPGHTLEWVVAAIGAAAFLLLPALVNPDWIGMGDVKLALLIGAALGHTVVDALLLGFASVLPVGIWMLIRGGLAARHATIPFAPFLAFGALVIALAG